MKVNSFFISFLILVGAFLSAAKADLVDWFLLEYDGRVYEDSTFSSYVPNGTIARFGTFGADYVFSGKSFLQLYQDFEEWDSTTIDSGFFFSQNALTDGPINTPWYFFLGDSEAAFGIFANPAWVNSGVGFVQLANLANSGTYAAGGFGVMGSGAHAGDVALVPEPTALFLIGSGSIAFLLMRRRRSV